MAIVVVGRNEGLNSWGYLKDAGALRFKGARAPGENTFGDVGPAELRVVSGRVDKTKAHGLFTSRMVCVALRLAIQNALRDDNWDTAQPHSRRYPHPFVPRAACDEPPNTACHYLPE